MLVGSTKLEALDYPGKGFIIWSGYEFWVYVYYRDNPKKACFIIGTKDLIKAFEMIDKEWE